MTAAEVTGGGSLKGEIRPPGDKSISHRCLLMGALARGPSRVRGLLESADVRATRGLVEALGVRVEDLAAGEVRITPPEALREPEDVIDCQNSGTTARLSLGLLAGLPFSTTLTGDGSLRKRPMKRVVEPLRTMGGRFLGRSDADLFPLTVTGGALEGIDHALPVASGQVKGALLLAGLQANGITTLTGELAGRDHTERMLAAFGVELHVTPEGVTLPGGQRPEAFEGSVPADPSSAAFFLVGAAITPGSELRCREVGTNPGRTGILDVLAAMGAAIETEEGSPDLGEPRGTFVIRGGDLKGVRWEPGWVVRAIDEIPVLAVAACFAEGETLITGAEELRVKESDRLATITAELRKMGAEIEERPDGLRIEGPQELRGATVESHHDHRIAMALAIAALRATGTTQIRGAEVVDVSYPGFFSELGALRG